MKFLYLICVIIIDVVAFRINLFLGIAAVLLTIAFLIYKYLPELYRAKGRKCFADGDYQGTKAWFEKSMKIKHANGDIRMEYSYVLLRTGDIDKAESIVNNILCYKIKPQMRAKAVIQRCMCYYKRGNMKEALDDGMELYNDGYRSIMLYGMIGFFMLIVDPNSEKTFNFCKEAYEYADDDRDICDNMMICWYNKGDYKKAKEISDKVIEKAPKFIEAWYHAAQVENKMGNYEEALKKLEHIKECNRSFMTTISVEEIEKLKNEINAKIKVNK